MSFDDTWGKMLVMLLFRLKLLNNIFRVSMLRVILNLFLRVPVHLRMLAMIRWRWDMAVMMLLLLEVLLLPKMFSPTWVFDLKSLVIGQRVRSRLFPHFRHLHARSRLDKVPFVRVTRRAILDEVKTFAARLVLVFATPLLDLDAAFY